MADVKKMNKDGAVNRKTSPVKNRRSFLKKSVIGASIATIPAHSVWAGRLISGNMSGNVSGWAECSDLSLLSHGQYKSNQVGISNYPYNQTWNDIMGSERPPFGNANWKNILAVYFQDGKDPVSNDNITGPNNINLHILTMYFNAIGNDLRVKWPVVPNLFPTAEAYAHYLWKEAYSGKGTAVVGTQIDLVIETHHHGKNSCL